MSRQQGNNYEKQAADFLRKQGLILLTKNFYAYRGELDLVMQDKQTLVFIEVRYRKNTNFGTPEETVTCSKQRHLVKAAQKFLQLNQALAQLPCRFDVIAITQSGNTAKINWIKNAFLIT